MSGAAARTGGLKEKKNNNIYKITVSHANKKRQIAYRGLNERNGYIYSSHKEDSIRVCVTFNKHTEKASN